MGFRVWGSPEGESEVWPLESSMVGVHRTACRLDLVRTSGTESSASLRAQVAAEVNLGRVERAKSECFRASERRAKAASKTWKDSKDIRQQR